MRCQLSFQTFISPLRGQRRCCALFLSCMQKRQHRARTFRGRSARMRGCCPAVDDDYMRGPGCSQLPRASSFPVLRMEVLPARGPGSVQTLSEGPCVWALFRRMWRKRCCATGGPVEAVGKPAVPHACFRRIRELAATNSMLLLVRRIATLSRW